MSKTKKSLVSSTLALIMCIAMLIATTFAWFTDSVASGKNTIKAGNLKIAMYHADGTKEVPTDTGWTKVEQDKPIFDYDKWEPGYTVVKHIKIANEGSLALKYRLAFAMDGEVGKLAEALDVYVANTATKIPDRASVSSMTKLGTLKEVLAKEDLDLSGNLMPKGTDGKTSENTLTIAVKMREEAGNEYQGTSVNDFTVVVNATQYTYESDAFDNQYDKGAIIPVANNKEFAKTLEEANAGDVIKITKGVKVSLPNPDFTLKEGVNITGEAGSILKCDGYNGLKLTGNNNISNITIETNRATPTDKGYDCMLDVEGNNVTVENVTINTTTNITPIRIGNISSEDNNIMIKNCTLSTGFKAIHIVDGSKGTIVIENCCIDAVYPFNVNTTSNPEIIVKNSTLKGWTSYGATTKKVTFTNCTFCKGHGYTMLRAYADTVLTNCIFESDFTSLETMHDTPKTITISNCKKGETKITQSNVESLFGNGADTILQSGWTYTFN